MHSLTSMSFGEKRILKNCRINDIKLTLVYMALGYLTLFYTFYLFIHACALMSYGDKLESKSF